jgi:hypothetical protein
MLSNLSKNLPPKPTPKKKLSINRTGPDFFLILDPEEGGGRLDPAQLNFSFFLLKEIAPKSAKS